MSDGEAPRGDEMQTAEQVDFKTALRTYRRQRGYTLTQVSERLATMGVSASRQAVGAWERGAYEPGSREVVVALEVVLDAVGQLAPLLGYTTLPSVPLSLEVRLSQLEQTEAQIVRTLDELLRIVRRLGAQADDVPNGAHQ